jgi:hypothetical protein
MAIRPGISVSAMLDFLVAPGGKGDVGNVEVLQVFGNGVHVFEYGVHHALLSYHRLRKK